MKCPVCGWTIIGKCANPDCKKGDKTKRPAFRPPMRTQRGHAAGGRVRMYRGAGDTTIGDVDEQGPMHLYMDRYVPNWKKLSKLKQRRVMIEFDRMLAEHGVTITHNWQDAGAGAPEVTIVGSDAQYVQRMAEQVYRRVYREVTRRLTRASE